MAEKDGVTTPETLDGAGGGKPTLDTGEDAGEASTARGSPHTGEALPPSRARPLPVVDPAHYEVGREFSHGGTGRLLSARDRRLGRTVAIKQLRFRGAHVEARFRREAEITARLEHPAIVPIHEAGRWPNGEPFYAMKLVTGRSLREVIDGKTTLDERMALIPNVLAVAEAMAYAHSQRIIHRDLKPANILVGAFGETVVIDWGLAKDLSDASDDDDAPLLAGPARPAQPDLTLDGAVVGTPAYMPPEQAGGRPVDERADVYALGAVLYHVLAGVAPYRGERSEEVLSQVLKRPPRSLEARERGVPRDLVAVVERAMARAPADRYRDAGELAADLRRFLTGQLVRTHRYSTGVLLLRWLRANRRPALVATVALLVLAVLGVTGVRRITRERAAALAAQATAEARRNQLLLAHARGALEREPTQSFAWTKAYSTTDAADPITVRTLVAEAQGRGLARHVLRGCELATLSGDGTTLACRRASDGALTFIATASATTLDVTIKDAAALNDAALDVGGGQIAGVSDGELIEWDLAAGGGARRRTTALGEPGTRVAFSPDGKRLVVGGRKGGLLLVEQGGATRALVGHTGAIRALVFSPDGRWLVSNAFDATVRLWRLDETPAASRVVPDALISGGATTPAFSWQSDRIAWGNDDGAVRVADLTMLPTLTPRLLRGHAGTVDHVAFSPDGRSLVSAGGDRTVRRWSLDSGEGAIFRGHADRVSEIAFSPDGVHVASSGFDDLVILWDARSGDHVELRGSHNLGHVLRFSGNGRLLVSVDGDGQARVWPVAPPREEARRTYGTRVVHVGRGEGGVLLSFSSDGDGDLWTEGAPGRKLRVPLGQRGGWDISPDGKSIAGGGVDHTVWVLDTASGTTRVLGHQGGATTDVSFSPDGKTLATGSADRMVRLWDLQAGGGVRLLTGHEAGVWALAFSSDGKKLASGGDDHQVRVWDLASGTSQVLRGHNQRVADLHFRAGGDLVSSSADGTVRVWSLPSGAARVLRGHSGWVNRVASSPDGRQLASASDDRTVRLWDLASGKSQVLPHDSIVNILRYTHDGRRLVTGSTDGALRIFTVDGALESLLRGHHDSIVGIALADDDRWIATASEDHTARRWSLGPPPPPASDLRRWLDGVSTVELGSDDRPVTPRP